jgi:hypothetical protein
MAKRQTKSIRSPDSYTSTRYNAIKHGALSRVPVLPWEDAEGFAKLQYNLVKEYAPQGASEEHLVLEMANCIFRKQRVYQAENALIIRNMRRSSGYSLKNDVDLLVPNIDLKSSLGSKELNFKEVLHDNEPYQEHDKNLVAHKKYLFEVQAVIHSDISYEEMLEQCPVASINIWNDWLNDEDSGYTPDKKSFKEFLQTEVVDWCNTNLSEIQGRPYLRQQLIGLSYTPSDDMERLQRHEATLDRRLEKSLAMLIKIQENRAIKANTSIIDQPTDSVL